MISVNNNDTKTIREHLNVVAQQTKYFNVLQLPEQIYK